MNEDVQALVTGIIKKDGKTFARVSIMRGEDYAEYIIPDCRLDKSKGFSEEELKALEKYVVENRDVLMVKAKGFNPIKNWLGL